MLQRMPKNGKGSNESHIALKGFGCEVTYITSFHNLLIKASHISRPNLKRVQPMPREKYR